MSNGIVRPSIISWGALTKKNGPKAIATNPGDVITSIIATATNIQPSAPILWACANVNGDSPSAMSPLIPLKVNAAMPQMIR